MDKILKIEITDYCNAHCVFCNYDKTNTHMPYEQVVEIVEQVPEIRRIEPQHLGEPLLHPQFLNILHYLEKKNKMIVFHTNGSLLKGSMATTVASIAPEIIRFSIEADNKEDYEKLRVGLKWETVLDNIEKFQAMKSDKTETWVVMLKTEENKNDIDRIVKFWESRVDKVSVAQELSHGRELRGHSLKEPFKCWKIDKMITIKVDGRIVLCCEDWNADYPIGHVDSGVKKAINGKRARDLIKQVNQGKPLSICETCSVFWEGE